MAEDQVDQNIIIKYTVDASAALAENAAMEKAIEHVKQELQDLSNEGGKSMITMAESMKQAYATIRNAEAGLAAAPFKMMGKEGAPNVKEIMQQASTDIANYNKVINEALQRSLADLNAATKQSTDIRIAEEKRFADQQKLSIKQQEDAIKQKVAREKAALAESKAAQQEYINSWKSGIPIMSEGAKAFGDQVASTRTQIQQLSTQTGQTFAQVGQNMVKSGANINVVRQAIRELNAETQQTQSIFSRVGSAIQVALGIGLERIVMTTVQTIIRGFKEIIAAGQEYAQALVRLEVGTRALQKAGMDINFADVRKQIATLRSEFTIFTTKEIVEGIGQVQLLTQNLNLTKKQLENVTDVTTALAVIMGKDFNEAARSLALFMSSGYGEALQKAGILASRMSVQQELLNMGIKGGYMQATDTERALAAYNVIMKQSATITEEAKRVQGENIFKIREAETAWRELTSTIGERAIPTMAGAANMFTLLIKRASDAIGLYTLFFTQVETTAVQAGASVEMFYALLSRKISFKQYIDGLKMIGQSADDIKMSLLKQNFPDIFTGMEDAVADATKKTQEEYQRMLDIMQDLHQRMLDEEKSFNDEMTRLETDRNRDIEKINRDGLYRQEQLFTDFIRNIQQIEAKLAEDLYNENLKYESDVADALRDYANQKADIEQKYRNREIKAQKDFEEKMRRLREDFIMDMEDALRERDARQVLRLIRQFNLNQDRLKRERDSEREDRQREYRQELQDLEKQKNEKLATLAREHAARVTAIQRQAQIERQQAWTKYQQEMEDLRRNLENQRAERQISYDQQKADLEAQHAERYKMIAEALQAQYNLTAAQLERVMSLYRLYYGSGGELDAIYIHMAQTIASMNAALASLGNPSSYSSGPGGKGTPSNIGPGAEKGYATGGSFLAASPTIARFGEVPEIVTMTPVSHISRTPSVSGTKSGNGKIAIELSLSPDLIARVVDQTLDTNAEIMVDIQRRR